MAVTVVMLGIAANAATYNWKAVNDWYSSDGDSDLAGTAYIFDGSQYTINDIVSALTTSLSNAIDSQALDYGAFDFSGTGLTDDGAGSAHMFVIVMNETSDGYWASDMVDVAISDAIMGGQQAKFSFGEASDISFTQISSGTIPEPTSGLLLLLGVAGLALKRKRA